ncbi:MAG: cytochrome c biogenesis protein ResB [Erysipelotrichaceae bacterium]|nr:cytochrome c biogenesis protein ResB [Erysipelotrichaceae bacterium]
MKKVFDYLKSMQFGVLLLILICIISVAGSLIPQNEPAMTYVNLYPDHYGLIFSLQLDRVFTSWYFIVLAVLLFVNMTLCTINRLRGLNKMPDMVEVAFKAIPDQPLDPEQREEVIKVLEKLHCQKTEKDGKIVFERNRIGRYGTFVAHLGILLTLVFFAGVLYLPRTVDMSCYPKESIFLDDGTSIYVDSFAIEAEDGKLDYRSDIEVTLPDGRKSGLKTIRVNHPLTFGKYKIYQQTYGTQGYISATIDGQTDHYYLERGDVLTDGGNYGLIFDDLYSDFVIEDGMMSLETSTSGHYDNPIYVYTMIEDGIQGEMMLAFPGDVQEMGEYTITFEQPVEYPGLHIKKLPVWLNPMLTASFVLMTIGFYMCFFMTPVVVLVTEDGYRILGGKSEQMRYELKKALKKKE